MKTQQCTPSELVPASVIAERWHISKRTLQRAAASGKITAHRFGHRIVRYDPNEVYANMFTTSRDWEGV